MLNDYEVHYKYALGFPITVIAECTEKLGFLQLICFILFLILFYSWIPVSSVNIVTRLWAEQPTSHASILGRRKMFLSSPKHPLCIRSTSSLVPNVYRRLVYRLQLTRHLHLLPKLEVSGAMPPLLPIISLHVKEFTFAFIVYLTL